MTTGPVPVQEQLSAWLDDELPPAEVELLAARLAQDPEHRATLARYALIGASLRPGAAGPGAMGLSERVRAALETPANEPGSRVTTPHAAPAPSRVRRLAPFAVAAGIALAAVLLVPMLRPPAPPGALLTSTSSRVGAIPGSGPTVRLLPMVRGASLSPNRLTSYLVYHGEYSGMLSAKVADSHIVNNRSYVMAANTLERPAR